MKNPPRLAIVGAGMAGLTLARILHVHGIHAPVYEREKFPSVRSQGGSLDLHADAGQYAIQCAGLGDKFRRIARYDDQEERVYDKHGNLRFVEVEVTGKDRPEVDRGHLREMLLESLPAGLVKWDHVLRAVRPLDDGRFELAFENAVNEPFDLVVGADGGRSRIRPLVSTATPIYSGVTFIELGIDDVDNRYPEIARLVGRGLMFALGDGKALIGHRDANAHVGGYAALRVPEDWIEAGGLDRSSPAALRSSLAAHFDDWSADLRQIILQCGERITPRLIHALPVGHRWPHRPGVTIVGDAAHLMSPFGGDGANLAMRDAADLAAAIATAGDWQAAVESFELTMCARAEGAAAGASGAITAAFSENGLAHMLEMMQGHRE